MKHKVKTWASVQDCQKHVDKLNKRCVYPVMMTWNTNKIYLIHTRFSNKNRLYMTVLCEDGFWRKESNTYGLRDEPYVYKFLDLKKLGQGVEGWIKGVTR